MSICRKLNNTACQKKKKPDLCSNTAFVFILDYIRDGHVIAYVG